MENSLLAGKLLSHAGEVDAASVDAPILCVYFSAHWCPPCRNFTPKLVQCYNEWNTSGKKIEIIFVTSDRTEDAFKEYYETMPWLAIPFGDQRIQQLKKECGVSGIPMLCVVDKQGKLILDDARDTVEDMGSKALSELEQRLQK